MKCKVKIHKQTYRKIIWAIIVLFLGTLICVPKISSKADDNVIRYDDKIKILEVEPGNQYLLGGATTDDKPITTNSTDGHSVSITRMPMTKFISMVDEISGQYDVVVIGRENGYTWQDGKYVWQDGKYVCEDGKYVVKSGKTGLNSKYVQGTPYRDYTKPASQTYPSLPLTWWKSSDNPQMVDGINMMEYYSENDITDKRAKEIISMIKSGQLVYVDNSIFTTDAAKEISTTKLYKTFKNAWKDNTNFKPLNQSEINIDSIVRDYISSNNKRPKVNQIIKPTDDGNITDTKGQLSNRQMNFNITMDETGTFRAKLYLDINADGLFKDNDKVKELVETDEFTVDSQNLQHILQHNLDKDFIGYLDWKIEITNVANPKVKTNLLGSSKYKPLVSPRTINVLQIKTNKDYPVNSSGNSVGKGNLIDLSTDSNFTQLLENDSVKNDYTIKVTSMTINEANSKALSGTLTLNGPYNMVILGFEDGFGVYSENFEDFNDALITLLKDYIKTGQSVMFTHDTMAPALAYQTFYDPNGGKIITGAQALTRAFRDYIGQARYLDPYRSTEIKKSNTSTDLSGGDGNISNIDQSDLTKDTITHESYPNNSAYSIGSTLQGYVYSKSLWNLGWTPDIQKVKNINSAQISQYPFAFTDNMGLPRDTIKVAKTHAQWFQLNLEDEDVVPWFNLSDSNTPFDSLDSRNNYYTYSKGNITYSGTGHSKDTSSGIGFPDDELKLFVNTMIKAERGANHAPTINCSIPLENTDKNPQVNEVPAGKDYYFSVDAEDYEKEDITMHIIINGNELDSKNIVSTVDLSRVNNQELFKIETSNSKRTSVKFKIPVDQLPEAGENVSVVVEAKDSQRAKSVKNYVLKPVKSTSSIDVEFESAQPNPVSADSNSSINVKYKITPNDYYYKNINSQGPIDEAVVLVDTSQAMKMDNYYRFSQVQNELVKQVINDSVLNKIKLGVVAFNDSVYIGNRSNIDDKQSYSLQKTDENLLNIGTLLRPLYDISDGNQKDGYGKFYQDPQNLEGYIYNKISNNDQRQFGTALKAADSVLTKYGEVNAKKAIVIISAGNLTYSDDDDEIKIIRNKGYKIITVDISGSNNTNIETTYQKLGGNVDYKTGEKVDYFKGTVDSAGNYNYVDPDMSKVAKSLEKGISRTNIIDSAKLNFDLGSNFQMVGSTCSEGESIIKGTENNYSIDLLNKINYVATTETDGEGRTKYTANPFEITFQVKPAIQSFGNFGFSGLTFDDQNFENNKLSTLGTNSAPNNNFIYSDVFGQKTNAIFTPVIRIIPNVTLNHGLYNGMDINNGKPIIDETERTFAKGATVTLGAYIDGTINNLPIQINFDKRLRDENIDSSKIKVFKIENGKLQELNNNGSFDIDNKIYTYTPSSESGDKILILYNEVLPKNPDDYINTLTVPYIEPKEAKIRVAGELPDLF